MKVPTNEAGKPSSSMSQRTAIESMWLPGCSHQRCGLATAWARCAAVAIVVGAVVTQPVKPGWPMRRPRGMTTSRRVSRTASAPTPCSGSGSSSRGSQAERGTARSGPSKRLKASSAGRSAEMASPRPSVRATSGWPGGRSGARSGSSKWVMVEGF